MADSDKPSITARTSCPTETVEGTWTLENFPALIQRDTTSRIDGQEAPPGIATISFKMNCKVG